MDEKLFNQLVDSVLKAGATHRTGKQSSHSNKFDVPDVKAIREKTG